MRLTLAGLLLLSITASAFGQAEGQVVSMGLGSGYYRPNCWTPLKIHLKSKIGDAATYKLTVIQEDMDHDRVLYSRLVTLNGNSEQARGEEDVWAYFLPQPRDFISGPNGLPNLRIFICDPSGKQLVQIPLTSTSGRLRDLDVPDVAGFGAARHGQKLVLFVKDPSSALPRDPYGPETHGAIEDVIFETVSPRDLPTEAIAYQCVDAIVLLNFNPAGMSAETLAAIEQWVREGGRLVVCAGRNWLEIKSSPLGELLPVVMDRADDHERDARSLRRLAGLPDRDLVARYFKDFNRPGPPAGTQPATQPAPVRLDNVPGLRNLLVGTSPGRALDPWMHVNGDSTIIRATPRPGAVVTEWSLSDPASPYLARWLQGYGSVTWVAQDLGDPVLIEARGIAAELSGIPVNRETRSEYWGWPQVWDAVLDLPHGSGQLTVTGGMNVFNEAYYSTSRIASRVWQDQYQKYAPGGVNIDPSTAFFGFTNFPTEAVGLLALAVLFFIAYWAVAGPGSYFLLLARKRVHYSWIAFAVCALGATLLAAGIVKLVLRGPPTLRHVTIVRAGANQPAVAISRIGLRVKQDGDQRIRLPGTDKQQTAYIAPLPRHPQHLASATDVESLGYREYEVPTRLTGTSTDAQITVPYRSTQKRFDARWVGQLPGVIDGQAMVADASSEGRARRELQGKLTNSTGTDLYDVYLAFRTEMDTPGTSNDDFLMRLIPPGDGPAWPKGQTLDLGAIFANSRRYPNLNNVGLADDAQRPPAGPNQPQNPRYSAIWAALNGDGWVGYWQQDKNNGQPLTGQSDIQAYNDAGRAFLVLSLYGRLAPLPPPNQNGYDPNRRLELLRLAGRDLDASPIVSSGQLLILARSNPAGNAPLPFPLEVEGDRIGGEGPVFYQFVVPIVQRPAPTTRPAQVETVENDRVAPEREDPSANPQPTRRPPFPSRGVPRGRINR